MKPSTLAALFALALVGCKHSGPGGDQTRNCKPITCADANATCGVIDDQCGGDLYCGGCDAPLTCNPTTNACACDAKPNACDGKCGKIIDNCGMEQDCDACASGDTCGAGGPNVCGTGSCTPITCATANANCGKIADGCGELVDCGSCSGGSQTCGGGGKANQCGCTPITCLELGKDCDSISDGCGNMLACGTCSGSATCGGSGVANVCGGGNSSHIVTLKWNAPTTDTSGNPIGPGYIAGYRVYFGVASHSYGPPIDIGNAVTHDVAGLTNGQTYFFAVTAYDTSNNESGYSNEATVPIPAN
jgi:hypothetical protein